MPAGAAEEIVVNGTSYGWLFGEIGLAPQWGEPGGTCDDSCKRWVSACVLARVNYYGTPIQISMRGAHPALAVSDTERTAFSLREGAYFGDIFDSVPALHTCTDRGAYMPELTNRICAAWGEPCPLETVGECTSSCDDPDQTEVCEALDDRGEQLRCGSQWYACTADPTTRGALRGGYPTFGWDFDEFEEVITVYLRPPVAECGNGICEVEAGESATTCGDCDLEAAITVATTGAETLDAVTILPSGDILTAGRSDVDGIAGAQGVFFTRRTSDGTEVWTRVVPTAPNTIIAIDDLQATANGDFVVLAQLDGSVYFGNGLVLSGAPGASDLILARFDSSGGLLWARNAGSTAAKFPAPAMAIASNDGILVTAGAGSPPLHADDSFNTGEIVARYDSSGELQWVEPLPRLYRAQVASGPDGSAVVAGLTRDTGWLGVNRRCSRCGVVLRFSADGALDWSAAYRDELKDEYLAAPIGIAPAENRVFVVWGTATSSSTLPRPQISAYDWSGKELWKTASLQPAGFAHTVDLLPSGDLIIASSAAVRRVVISHDHDPALSGFSHGHDPPGDGFSQDHDPTYDRVFSRS